MSIQIKKLVTFPSNVWDDVQEYVKQKYRLRIPVHNFNFSRFLYGKGFDYRKFIVGITERQAMLLFTLICKKLGVGFIPDSQGWKVVCLEETADQLLNYVKYTIVDLEEVRQPEEEIS